MVVQIKQFIYTRVQLSSTYTTRIRVSRWNGQVYQAQLLIHICAGNADYYCDNVNNDAPMSYRQRFFKFDLYPLLSYLQRICKWHDKSLYGGDVNVNMLLALSSAINFLINHKINDNQFNL